jgi:hypothetical protein
MVVHGTDQNDALVRGVKHVLENGALIALQPGAPGVPVRPITAVPLRIEEVPSVHLATQMPTGKGLVS